MDEITLFISSVLGESQTAIVVDHLKVLGAESLDDLRFVNAEDVEVLPLLKRRRLGEAIKTKFQNSQGDLGERPSDPILSSSVATSSSTSSSIATSPSRAISHHLQTANGFCEIGNSSAPGKMTCSILDALQKHPDKDRIIAEMEKIVPDERMHRQMIKSACTHLLDTYGRYPAPEKQLAMAVDIVRAFPKRSCKAGKGHEMYYCVGSAKGFITSRMREIYRNYPKDSKKYKPRKRMLESDHLKEQLSEEEYNSARVRLSHISYSERSETEIVDLMQKTLQSRRLWIKSDHPTITEILRNFPRFLDTPSLMSQEFSWCHPEARESSSTFFETLVAPKILDHCKSNNLCKDIMATIIQNAQDDPEIRCLAALKCLINLLPSMGKTRVSAGVGLQYMFQEASDDYSTMDESLREQQEINGRLKRSQPYILKLGSSSYFVVVDCNPIAVKPASIAVAIDMLFKTFYVFDVKYPAQLQVTCNFLQHVILNLKASLSAKALKLLTELNLE